MSVRLIAFDLDGTLLDAERRVSPYTAEVLARAAALEDLTLVAASGRSRRAVDLALGDCAAVDDAICSNGAVVYKRSTGDIRPRHGLVNSRTKYADLHHRVGELIDGACWA